MVRSTASVISDYVIRSSNNLRFFSNYHYLFCKILVFSGFKDHFGYLNQCQCISFWVQPLDTFFKTCPMHLRYHTCYLLCYYIFMRVLHHFQGGTILNLFPVVLLNTPTHFH